MTGLVLTTCPVEVMTIIIVVSPSMAVPAHVEGLACNGVMTATVAPGAGAFVEPGVVGPRVIKVVTALLYFIGHHDLSWGVVEYNL